MPYNPGIQDISGQLLAQGMQARAQGIAGGVTTLFQGLQQNQMMTNQAIARFQAATAANPKLLDFLNKAGSEESPVPVNPDVLKAYSDIKSGKTNVQNTALLAQFADSYNQAEMAQQQQQLRQAQMQQMAQENLLRQAQASKLGMEVERMRAENAFFKDLEDRTKQETQEEMVAPPVRPSPQAAAPAQIPYFLRRDVTGQAAPSAAPAEAIAAMTPPSVALAAATGQVRPSSAITPKDILDARQQLGPGANIAQIRMTAQKNVEARAKEFMPEGLYSSDQAARQRAAELDQANPIPGSVRDVEYVPQARAFTIKPVAKSKTPEEEIALEAGKKGATSLVERASSQKTADIAEAGRNRMIMPAVVGLTKLYAEGNLEGGALAENFAQARNLLKSLNIPVDEEKLGQAQLAKGYVGQLILPYFNQFKGSMSNNDVKLIQSWNPSLATDPKVGTEMMKALDARITFGRKLEALATKADATNMKDTTYIAERQKIIDEYDSSIESPASIIEQAAKKQTGGAGQQQGVTRVRVWGKDF